MSFNLTSSQAIIGMAGLNVNSNISTSGALMAKFCDQAEAMVGLLTRKDWVLSKADITANLLAALDEVVASYAAIKLINYDMSGYTNSGEATTMVNILLNNFNKGVALLEKMEIKDFVLSA